MKLTKVNSDCRKFLGQRLLATLGGLASLLSCFPQASAQTNITVFNDELAWQSAHSGFRLEGFDDQAGGSLGVSTFTFTSGLRVTASASDLYIAGVGIGDSVGGSAPNVLTDVFGGTAFGMPSEFTFELPVPAIGAGLLIIDHENGDLPEWLDFFDHDTLIERIQPLPFDNTGGGTPTTATPAYFLGISSGESSITRMVVRFDRPGFFADSVAFDNVQFAVVPEPSNWILVGLGYLAISFSARSKLCPQT